MNTSSTMPEGLLFEKEFFGAVTRTQIRVSKYMTRPDAMKYVRDHQTNLGWNPQSPVGQHAPVLFREVQARLSEHLRKDLRFYVGVGTSLDTWGIDAFFELRRQAVVTIDISLRHAKPELRSDFLINQLDIRDNFESVSKRIAALLTRRLR